MGNVMLWNGKITEKERGDSKIEKGYLADSRICQNMNTHTNIKA